MAEQPSRRDAPGSRRGGPGMPGWRVTQPPGDRARPTMPPGGQPPRTNGRWVALALLVGLLLLNLWLASVVTAPASRVAIPFSPTFLNQINAHNVTSITSTGESVQGTFAHAIAYPPGGP